ncbi:Solute carrier family 22 member 20 [Apodemus speciosus]|uniref:Solute carrier family 22 member 20 n=1 Tax=Apodemus speciosus TaxID=105296 RepID=A0ABQ0FS43_APOSI
MAFSDLLDTLGGVGRFQIVYTALLLGPCGLLACHTFLQNFTAASPSHHCRQPANNTEPTTNGSEAWLRAAIPLNQHGVPEPCLRYIEPQWNLLKLNASSHGVATEGCKDGWVYDRSIFPSTIVMEWDLVCESRTLRDLAQSIYMSGVLVGAALFGSLADRLGRKAPLVWSYLQLAVSGAATAYVGSFSSYCVFRFLVGMTFSGIILNSLSLVVEWMPTRGRTVAGVLLGFSFTLGQLVLAGVAYLIRPWRWLQFAVSAPFLIFFLYSWWLPESSRWLLLHGKAQQAVQNLRKVAKINGRKAEGERLTMAVVSSYVQDEFASVCTSNSMLDLFRTPAIRKVTCCLMVHLALRAGEMAQRLTSNHRGCVNKLTVACCTCNSSCGQMDSQARTHMRTRTNIAPKLEHCHGFSNSVAYYGLAMDLQKFGFSIHLVQALFGIIDIPAMLVATTTMIYVGRRITVSSFLVLAGLMVIANMFVPEDLQTLRTVQAALGKGCLASSFICLYLFTGELYPTEIRQMGMGFASVNARVGGLVAPLITVLGEISPVLPPVSFGATSVLAGMVVTCFLTETLNVPLVETIAAMERRVKEGHSKRVTAQKTEEISLQQLGASPLKETV